MEIRKPPFGHALSHGLINQQETSPKLTDYYLSSLEDVFKEDKKNLRTLKSRIIKLFICVLAPLYKKWCETSESSRTEETLRTQEHLGRLGSLFFTQKKQFMKFLKKETGEDYKKFYTELKKTISSFLDGYNLGIFSLVRNRWVKGMRKKIQNLNPGESALINAGSVLGNHGMMMRIKCTSEGKYDLYYSNSGSGLIENPDFHPSETTEKGKKVYQTTAVIRNIDKSLLVDGNFFTNFHKAAHGKVKSQKKLKGEAREDEIVCQMYDVLRQLGSPTPCPKESYPQFWGRAQLGGSCVPSSLWAMTKTLLSREEVRELKNDMRLHTVLIGYKRITSGWDNTSTRKILVLDQVQKLKGVYKKQGEQPPEILEQVEQELSKRLDSKDPEAPIIIKSKQKIEKFIHPAGDGHLLKPIEMKIKKSRLSKIELFASFKEGEGSSYSVKQDANKMWVGSSHVDTMYLFSLYVASGRKKEASLLLDEILSQTVEMKKDLKNLTTVTEKFKISENDNSKSEKEISDLYTKIQDNKSEIETKYSEYFKEVTKTTQSLTLAATLVWDLKHDHTRSGIAKRLVLAELAATQLSLLYGKDLETTDPDQFIGLIDEKGELVDHSTVAKTLKGLLAEAKENYANLHVDFYLSEDNIWVNAHQKIIAM